ncbi:MAG: branched-chain amino acid ABC transporter ATP-binding protein/permease [Chloroflexi bacterium]|nr:branched-chain amino acid ABC transporter ATP-binding protein/permease [Chloroflexota bacterium]MCL5107466.1 branched-chain amino acid ABC transporter ATP-binding protein/permease [Chloroflexota bacterium]
MKYLKHPLPYVAIVVLVLPFIATSIGTTYSIATEVLVWAIVGLGFNLLCGYTGLLSFGHGVFFGTAAYTAAILQIHFMHDMFVPMLGGVIVGTLVGVAEGYLVLRRRGVYFSLLTLAFAQMFFYIAYAWTGVTGGESGLGGFTRLPVFGLIDVRDKLAFYYFVAFFTLILMVVMWSIVRSPFGRVLAAIKQNEPRAKAVGYNTQRYKWLAFSISAFFTAVGGAMYAYVLEFMYADTLSGVRSGEIAAMTIVGGMFSFIGPMLGAAFYVFLRDYLMSYTENWLIFFGFVFMLFIVFSPAGIVGIVQRLWSLVRPAAAPPAPVKPIGGASEEAVVAPEPARPRAPLGEEIFACSGVTKKFGALVAVDNVDLSVRQGELHSIIGPNGAGKTTLFNCLNSMLTPDGGKITFEGQEITGKPPYEIIAHGIARSFQIISIFKDLTVFENVRIAAQAKSKYAFSLNADPDNLEGVNEKVREALELVGLVGMEKAVAANLSHGDQRLLEIAIALATTPKMLMLDEPLAGLSPAERTRIANLIRQLAGERTVLLIEHDVDRVLELSDRITVMHQGKVIARGTPAEIQGNSLVQEAYLGASQMEEVKLTAKGPRTVTSGETILRVDRINSFYGKSHVLHNVSLEVREGEAVCLLGRNGVGKTTTLSSIVGTVPPREGQVYFGGQQISGQGPEVIGRMGIALVPQGRRIFPNLTVGDNLGIARRACAGSHWDLRTVYKHFPKLETLRGRRGENLSGGELQMLAIARALMANPRLLLLDEAMEGLAPAIVAEVAHMIQELRGQVTILLVEQSAPLALALCDRAYVMSSGQIIWEGPAKTLADDIELRTRLLGV